MADHIILLRNNTVCQAFLSSFIVYQQRGCENALGESRPFKGHDTPNLLRFL